MSLYAWLTIFRRAPSQSRRAPPSQIAASEAPSKRVRSRICCNAAPVTRRTHAWMPTKRMSMFA
eukprot:3139630-Pleurochrysis_carterae.AAC.1